MDIKYKDIIKSMRFEYYINERNFYMGISQYKVGFYPAEFQEVCYGDEKIREGNYTYKPYFTRKCIVCLRYVRVYCEQHWEAIDKLCCNCFVDKINIT